MRDGYETYRRVAFAVELAAFVTIAVCLVILTIHFAA